jgi:hypothetical protein
MVESFFKNRDLILLFIYLSMNWKIGVRIVTGVLSVLCFTVAGMMYSKLNFIDTPYVVMGLAFLLPTLFLKSR